MYGMHRTQFDHARLDLLSLEIWSRALLTICHLKLTQSKTLEEKAKSCPVSYRTINQYGGTISLLLGLISSPVACMHVNLAMLTVQLNYVKQWVEIFKLLSVSGGRVGRQRQLKRLGRQPRPRRMMIECAFMKLKGRKWEEFPPTSPGY